MIAIKEQLERLVDEMVTRGVRYEDAQREFEKKFISQVLQQHRGNLSRAAQDLRIHRNTLARWLRKPFKKGGPPRRKFPSGRTKFPKQEFVAWANGTGE